MTSEYATLLAQVLPVFALAAVLELRSILGRMPSDQAIFDRFRPERDRVLPGAELTENEEEDEDYASATKLGEPIALFAAATLLGLPLIFIANLEIRCLMLVAGVDVRGGSVGPPLTLVTIPVIAVLSVPVVQAFFRLAKFGVAIWGLTAPLSKGDSPRLRPVTDRARLLAAAFSVILVLSSHVLSYAAATRVAAF